MTEDKQIRNENTIRFIKRKTLGWAMGVALLIIICVIVSSLAALIEAGIMLVLKCQFSPLRFLFLMMAIIYLSLMWMAITEDIEL